MSAASVTRRCSASRRRSCSSRRRAASSPRTTRCWPSVAGSAATTRTRATTTAGSSVSMLGCPSSTRRVALASFEDLEERIEMRNELAAVYRDALSSRDRDRVPLVPDGDRSTYKDLTILVDEARFGMDADALQRALKAEGIDTRRYYSPPVHAMRAYRTVTVSNGGAPGDGSSVAPGPVVAAVGRSHGRADRARCGRDRADPPRFRKEVTLKILGIAHDVYICSAAVSSTERSCRRSRRSASTARSRAACSRRSRSSAASTRRASRSTTSTRSRSRGTRRIELQTTPARLPRRAPVADRAPRAGARAARWSSWGRPRTTR